MRHKSIFAENAAQRIQELIDKLCTVTFLHCSCLSGLVDFFLYIYGVWDTYEEVPPPLDDDDDDDNGVVSKEQQLFKVTRVRASLEYVTESVDL